MQSVQILTCFRRTNTFLDADKYFCKCQRNTFRKASNCMQGELSHPRTFGAGMKKCKVFIFYHFLIGQISKKCFTNTSKWELFHPGTFGVGWKDEDMKSFQFLNFSGGTILGRTNTFYNSERNKFCKDIKLHARRAQQLLDQDGEMKKCKVFHF